MSPPVAPPDATGPDATTAPAGSSGGGQSSVEEVDREVTVDTQPRTQSSIDDVPTRTVTLDSSSSPSDADSPTDTASTEATSGDSGVATAPSVPTGSTGPTAPPGATPEPRPEGTYYDTERDADGNVVSSTATTYDDAGNVTRVVARTFDDAGNVTSSSTTVNVHDANGLVTSSTSVIVDGVQASATQEAYSESGTLIQQTTTTYDADGDRDTRVERSFDEGGAPLMTTTTVYDDDGVGMMQTQHLEDGRTITSYNEGEHVRTTRADDGTVTRETLVVNENGSPTSRQVEETDATGEVQHSEQSYYDSDGNVKLSTEVTYTDGQANSMRTVTVDDEGTYVSQQALDDELNPVSEVRTSYDSEGNVTSTTYVEYADNGEISYQGDEPRNAHLFDQIEASALDLSATAGSVDASDVMAALRGDAPPISAEGLQFDAGAFRPSGSSTATSTATSTVAGGAGSDSTGSAAAENVVTTTFDEGDVAWEQVVTEPDGSIRVIRGYADGSIEIERPSKWLADTGLDELPDELLEHLTVVERISPDGTRTVREPVIEDLDLEDLESAFAGLLSPSSAFGGPPDLSFLTTVTETTYGADGQIERAATIEHDVTGDVVYRQDSVIDGPTTTTTVTRYEDGVAVDETITQTTESDPATGLPDLTGDPVARSLPDGLVADGSGLGMELPELPDVFGETTATNSDGTTIVTRRVVGDTEVAWEQTITESDGSVRVVRGYHDGAIETQTTSELVELFGDDALGGVVDLPESYADHFRVVERIGADGSRTVRAPVVDAEVMESMMSSLMSSPGSFAFGSSVPAFDPTMFLAISEAEYAADGSVVTTSTIYYDEQLNEVAVEETVHHDDGTTTTTTTTQSGEAEADAAEGDGAEADGDDADPMAADQPEPGEADAVDTATDQAVTNQIDVDQAARDRAADAGDLDTEGLGAVDGSTVDEAAGGYPIEHGDYDPTGEFGDVSERLADALGADPETFGRPVASQPGQPQFGDVGRSADDAGYPQTDVFARGAEPSELDPNLGLWEQEEGAVVGGVDGQLNPNLGLWDPEREATLQELGESPADFGSSFDVGSNDGELQKAAPSPAPPPPRLGDAADVDGDDFIKFDGVEGVPEMGDPAVDFPKVESPEFEKIEFSTEAGPEIELPSDGVEAPLTGYLKIDDIAGESVAGVDDVADVDEVALSDPLGDDFIKFDGVDGVPEMGDPAVDFPKVESPEFEKIEFADPLDDEATEGWPAKWSEPEPSELLAEPAALDSPLAEPVAIESQVIESQVVEPQVVEPQVVEPDHSVAVSPEPVFDAPSAAASFDMPVDIDVSVEAATFHEPIEAAGIVESFDEPALEVDLDAVLGDDPGDGIPGG